MPRQAPMQSLAFPDAEGNPVAAPIGVWVGAMLTDMPEDWRNNVITYVKKYMAAVNQATQRPSIIVPGR